MDLVRSDDNWQEWDFCQLVDSVREPQTVGNPEKHFRRENLFQVRDKDQKHSCVCLFDEKPGHKSSDCELVSGTPKRRLKLLK